MSTHAHNPHEEFATGIPAESVIADTGGLSREECARRLGISHEAVRQAEQRAIRWLWRRSVAGRNCIKADGFCRCPVCQRANHAP